MLASSSVNASPAINFALALAFKLACAVASLFLAVSNSDILTLISVLDIGVVSSNHSIVDFSLKACIVSFSLWVTTDSKSTTSFNSTAVLLTILCNALDLDYDKVIEYATLDNRLGNSHWAVPGPDGDFGFGGHCFPKDLSALIKMTDDLGTVNNILKSVEKTNCRVRKNRDWEKMKGRAIN